LSLPDRIKTSIDADALYTSDEARVGLAIELSRRNVENATGGAFGAAVFSGESRLISVRRDIARDAARAVLAEHGQSGRTY
jgi:hypothetical protein